MFERYMTNPHRWNGRRFRIFRVRFTGRLGIFLLVIRLGRAGNGRFALEQEKDAPGCTLRFNQLRDKPIGLTQRASNLKDVGLKGRQVAQRQLTVDNEFKAVSQSNVHAAKTKAKNDKEQRRLGHAFDETNAVSSFRPIRRPPPWKVVGRANIVTVTSFFAFLGDKGLDGPHRPQYFGGMRLRFTQDILIALGQFVQEALGQFVQEFSKGHANTAPRVTLANLGEIQNIMAVETHNLVIPMIVSGNAALVACCNKVISLLRHNTSSPDWCLSKKAISCCKSDAYKLERNRATTLGPRCVLRPWPR